MISKSLFIDFDSLRYINKDAYQLSQTLDKTMVFCSNNKPCKECLMKSICPIELREYHLTKYYSEIRKFHQFEINSKIFSEKNNCGECENLCNCMNLGYAVCR
jgi:hypothetical protein